MNVVQKISCNSISPDLPMVGKEGDWRLVWPEQLLKIQFNKCYLRYWKNSLTLREFPSWLEFEV